MVLSLGGNHYKVPHMRKAVLERLGTLPVALECAANIVRDAIEFLPEIGRASCRERVCQYV